jgi:hypothetical protein
MKATLIAYSFLVVLGQSSAGQAASPSAAPILELITIPELTQLVADVSIEPRSLPEVIVSHLEKETFHKGGSYQYWNGLSQQVGTFKIKNDKVCVRIERDSQCFMFYRDRQGMVWKVFQKGSKSLVVIKPL